MCSWMPEAEHLPSHRKAHDVAFWKTSQFCTDHPIWGINIEHVTATTTPISREHLLTNAHLHCYLTEASSFGKMSAGFITLHHNTIYTVWCLIHVH